MDARGMLKFAKPHGDRWNRSTSAEIEQPDLGTILEWAAEQSQTQTQRVNVRVFVPMRMAKDLNFEALTKDQLASVRVVVKGENLNRIMTDEASALITRPNEPPIVVITDRPKVYQLIYRRVRAQPQLSERLSAMHLGAFLRLVLSEAGNPVAETLPEQHPTTTAEAAPAPDKQSLVTEDRADDDDDDDDDSLSSDSNSDDDEDDDEDDLSLDDDDDYDFETLLAVGLSLTEQSPQTQPVVDAVLAQSVNPLQTHV